MTALSRESPRFLGIPKKRCTFSRKRKFLKSAEHHYSESIWLPLLWVRKLFKVNFLTCGRGLVYSPFLVVVICDYCVVMHTVLWSHSALQGNCGTYTANELCGFVERVCEIMLGSPAVVLCSNYSHRIGSCTMLVLMVDWRMLTPLSKKEQTQIGRILLWWVLHQLVHCECVWTCSGVAYH